jgi:hypothetical protein
MTANITNWVHEATHQPWSPRALYESTSTRWEMLAVDQVTPDLSWPLC